MKNVVKIVAAAATFVSIASGAIAEEVHEGDLKGISRAEVMERAAERFDRADANGDGYISRDEMETHRGDDRGDRSGGRHGDPEAFFARVDTDRNGEVSKVELKGFFEKARERRPEKDGLERGPERAGEEPREFGDRVFEKFDMDGNGSLSKGEFSRSFGGRDK